MNEVLGRTLPSRWLDFEPVANVLHSEVWGYSLDEWLDHFDIERAVHHHATFETRATAELLLRLWPAGCAALRDVHPVDPAGRASPMDCPALGAPGAPSAALMQ